MNKVYRVIWNHSLQGFVAVAEFARVKTKNHSKVTVALLLSSVASISFAEDKLKGVSPDSQTSNTIDRQQLVEVNTHIPPLTTSLTTLLKKDELLFPLLSSGSAVSFGIPAMPFAVDQNSTVNIVVNGSVEAKAAGLEWAMGGLGERRTDGKGISMAGIENPSSMAIGSGALNQAGGGIAIGSYTKITESSLGAVALGSYATSTGRGAISLGSAAYSAAHAIALGGWSVAEGMRSNAIGVLSAATAVDTTAIGTSAMASGTRSIALGSSSNIGTRADPNQDSTTNTHASGEDSIAIGSNAKATATKTLALGQNSSASLINTLAIGSNANASAENAVALGASSIADRSDSISIGSANATRQLINLTAGTASNDAVNVAQLTPLVDALGGDSRFNTITGVVTGPSYILNGINATNGESQTATTTFSSVGTALSSINSSLSNLSNAALRYTDAVTKAAIRLDGEQGTTLSNLQAGTLSKNSNEAVNGSQLFATNADVAKNTEDVAANRNNIATNTTAINTLTHSTVSYVDAATKAVIKLGGEQGTTLSNLKAGTLSQDSNEAVNGSQLFTTNTDVAKNTQDIASNSSNITSLTSNLTTITNELKSGIVGLVQQDVKTQALTVAAATGGTNMSLAGTEGDRTLQGVKSGILSQESNEAVNGSQLFTTNTNIEKNTKDIVVNNNNISVLNEKISAISTELTGGNIGLVQQQSDTLALTVAALTGGDTISFRGSAGNRVLSGVSAGKADEDAVNIGQLKDLFAELGANNASIDTASGKISGPKYSIQGVSYNLNESLAALDNNISAMKSTLEKVVTYNDDNSNKITLGNANPPQLSAATATATAASKTPVQITNLADGNIAAGSSDAVNGNQLHSVQTQVTQNSKDIADLKNSSGVGLIQQDSSTQALSVGKNNSGKTVSFTGTEGDRRLTGIANGVADNDAATVAQVKEIAGASSTVASNNSSKRAKAVATGADSSALGSGAQASAANTLALGSNAKATASNAIALGNDSVADRANALSVGSAGSERQITHVARGTAGTDAVNVNQLNEGLAALSDTTNQKFRDLGSRMNDMNDKLKAGVASAMAMAALPQSYQANSGMMAMGGSSYNGQSALAIGASKISENGKWVSKVQGSTNTQGDFGVSAGIGYQW